MPWRDAPLLLPLFRWRTDSIWSITWEMLLLKDTEQAELGRILEASPILAQGYHLIESFQPLVAQRNVGGLDAWMEEACRSGLRPVQALAKGFRRDYEAIKLALITPWSTAQCEGQNCRVELIQRLGYGRAKLDLLRQRILHRQAAA